MLCMPCIVHTHYVCHKYVLMFVKVFLYKYLGKYLSGRLYPPRSVHPTFVNFVRERTVYVRYLSSITN